MACRTGCLTQDHASWGECARAANLEVAGVEAHRRNQSMHRAIDAYVDARHEGMQPQTIFPKDVKFAREMTKATGVPYRADKD